MSELLDHMLSKRREESYRSGSLVSFWLQDPDTQLEPYRTDVAIVTRIDSRNVAYFSSRQGNEVEDRKAFDFDVKNRVIRVEVW